MVTKILIDINYNVAMSTALTTVSSTNKMSNCVAYDDNFALLE